MCLRVLPPMCTSLPTPKYYGSIFQELFLLRVDGLNNLSVGLGGSLFTNALIRALASSTSSLEPIDSNKSTDHVYRTAMPIPTHDFDRVVVTRFIRNSD